MTDREKIDKETNAVVVSKDSALFEQEKFSGIAYHQLFPISTIYETQYTDHRNFDTDFRKRYESERYDMISKMNKFKETQYQYTED